MKYFLSALAVFINMMVMSEGSAAPKTISLPAADKQGRTALEQVLNQRRSKREYLPEALSLEEVSQVLWAAYGKNKWGRLTAPSAGALYPLTIYLAAGKVSDLEPGLYRYDYDEHSLRLILARDLRAALGKAALGQRWVKEAAAVIVICADYNITTANYRERGRRYVDIEVGHVGQNIYLQAQSLHLGTVAVGAFNDREVKKVLKISQDPLYIMPLGKVK